ncbi:hypothetical protein [Lentzea sp. NPDC059081]|uniref:hypothetical protein n=1 Tax=Lentzea sp. NPDC059081 TaxID=3346719 RepID=UPI0036CE5994
MIEPDQRGGDGAWTHNRVDQNLGNSIQTGEARGDVNVGTSTYHSRTTTVSLSAVGVVIGVVMTVVIGLVVWKVLATDDPFPGPTPPTSSVPAQGSATATREVRLQPKTGVDVDGDDPTARRVEGATGETDLYLTEFSLLNANGSGFSDDRGPEQEARKRCTEAVAHGDNSTTSVFPGTVGTQYCFVTSAGRVGWLRIKATTASKFDSSAAVVFAVHAWQP